MSWIFKLVMVALMLLVVSLLLCDVWDPALGTGNWQSSQYRLYINGTESTLTTSPFYSTLVSHLNDINQGPNADFKSEDGWRLYGEEFGDPGVTMQGYPVFGLYNEHLGLLRLFMYKPQTAGYTYIALKSNYVGNSTLFGFGEENSESGVKALDKRSQLGNCSFLRVFGQQTAAPCWYYIDLNLLYDPVQRIGQPLIYLSMFGATESSINLNVALSGLISSPNGSSNPDLLSMGMKLLSTYKNGVKQGQQINALLDEMNSSSNPTWGDLDLPPDIVSGLHSFVGFLAQNNAGNVIPWISTASSLFSMMSGRNNSKVSNTTIEVKGTISGTMTAQNNLVTTDFFESVSGVKSLTPVYNKTMGLIQMNTTPTINHAQIMYSGSTVGAHTYQLATNPPAFTLNPDAGLTLRNSELEGAIEFTLSFPATWTDYMDLTVGHSFTQMKEIGCYTLLRTESWINGMTGYYHETYRTPFMPLSQIYHTAFTVPRAVIDARVVVKAIMDVNSSLSSDPVYQLISFATNINNVANQSAIYPHIPAQLVTVLMQDLTLPNATQPNTTINLVKSYSVETGKTLRFQNCTVNLNNSEFGILVNNGRLEFSNCVVNCSEGFIRASSANSVISITNGSVINFNTGDQTSLLSNGAQLVIDGSSVSIQNGTMINLSNRSSFLATNSVVNLNGANLHLSGASSVSIAENSQFNVTGNSVISGETLCTYYDPASSGNGSLYGAEVAIPGDRIIVNSSKIQVAATSSISGTSRWDGISITDCSNTPVTSSIMGHISNISVLKIDNSAVELTSLQINNCGQLQLVNESDVILYSVNYHHNDYGIYVDESYICVWSSHINHNGSTGLSISYPSQNYGFLRGTEIAFNQGSGIELRHSLFNLFPYTEANNIHDNTRYGYLNLSNVPSFVYSTSINNNDSAEVIAMYDGFPMFRNQTDMPQSYVNDTDGFNPASFDRYLLAALACPAQNASIDVQYLSIDTSDLTRFFPNSSVFVLPYQPISDAEILYANALEFIYMYDYATAYTTMKAIISDYPTTPAAKKALPFLPYLDKAVGGDSSILLAYINSINEQALQEVKLEALGVFKLSNKQYDDAISYFEQIIQNPPSEEKKLIAELNEAYCYYKLVTEGSKVLPEKSHRKPMTSLEYAKIHDEIVEKIIKVSDGTNVENVVPTVVLENNYPNPFNPETTITFSVPLSSHVELSVYNIKGQKVMSLVNGCFNKGKHKVVWNGKDQAGNIVASGIYFSRLVTNGIVLSNKMILMK